MRKSLMFILVLLSLGVVVNAGSFAGDISVNVSEAGQTNEGSFDVFLDANETVNITTPQSSWFNIPDFPKVIEGNETNDTINNVDFIIKVPSNYTEPKAEIPLIGDFSKTGEETENLSVNIENVPDVVFNDSVTTGEILEIGAQNEMILEDIETNFAIFSLDACSESYLFMQEGDTESITCSDSQVILNLEKIDSDSIYLEIESNVPVSAKDDDDDEAEEKITIRNQGRVCPGKMMLFETMAGNEHIPAHAVILSVDGDAITETELSNGYGDVLIPKSVEQGIVIKATGTEDENLYSQETFFLDDSCEDKPSENETNETNETGDELALDLFSNEKEIEDGEACVSLRVTEKGGDGVEGANIIAFSDVVKEPMPKTGVSGYDTICFEEPAEYKMHAEKDNWKASEESTLKITAPEKPKKVKLVAFNKSGEEVKTPIPENSEIMFKLVNNDEETESFTGDVTFSLDGEKGSMSFEDGVSKHPKGGEYFSLEEGSYSFEVSESFDEAEGLDKTFSVGQTEKGTGDDNSLVIILLVVIGVIVLAVLVKRGSGGKSPKYGSPDEDEEVVEEL